MDKLPPLEKMQEQAFSFDKVLITGTRVYGPVTSESDIDIVLHYYHATRLSDFLTIIGIKVHFAKKEINPDYDGYKFDLPGLPTINIIVIRFDEEFSAWKYATQEMKKLDEISDKNERIKTFNFYKTEYKSGRKNWI